MRNTLERVGIAELLEAGSGPCVRVNLSIPVAMAEVLAELSAITGRSKAGYATEALSWYLPRLRELLAELRAAGVAQAGGHSHRPAAEVVPPDEAGRLQPEATRLQRATGGGEGLTRQQRRQLEREQAKAGRKPGGWKA